MLIDTHGHLNFNAYKDDADEVIRRSLEGDTWMINVGSQYDTSRRAVEIAEKYPQGVYAAVGLHPIHSGDEFDRAEYKELAKSKKVVAVGEIGLDYKQEYVSSKEKQKEVLLKQLDFAKELNLPVILHCRMAHEDLLELINSEMRGVIHCFTGNWQEAQKYLEMGFYFGFNGIIFKMDLEEVVKRTPLERILIETDCPYLTPPQTEGRNEPIYVKYVAEKITQLKNLTFKEVVEATTKNAKKLFKV
jgi:TatD DNase family protein